MRLPVAPLPECLPAVGLEERLGKLHRYSRRQFGPSPRHVSRVRSAGDTSARSGSQSRLASSRPIRGAAFSPRGTS